MSVWAVVVAALGFVASTVIAVAAVNASRQATNLAQANRVYDERTGRRLERREYFEVAQKWLAAARPNATGHGTVESPSLLEQTAHVIGSDTALKITKWIDDGQNAVIASAPAGSPGLKDAWDAFAANFGSRGALWVRNGEYSKKPWPPYTP
jgi:hypothetical protein